MSFRTVYGNTHSENGWRMCNRDGCVLVNGPFMNTAPLRAGVPAIVLGDFVRRYHTEVAPVVSPVWGWSLTNDVGNSNHLAATAVDINAPQWPWGFLRMPSAMVAKTNNLLLDYTIGGSRGVFWGRVWNKPDEMHFQLGWPEGDKRWAQLVSRIQGNPPTVGGGDIYAMLGDRGTRIISLQKFFNDVFPSYTGVVIDGIFGPRLEEIVRDFQKRSSILIDGIIGDQTLGKLKASGYKEVPKGDLPVTSPPLYAYPSNDDMLKQIWEQHFGHQAKGWPQLGKGKDGKDRTLVDGVAALIRKEEVNASDL